MSATVDRPIRAWVCPACDNEYTAPGSCGQNIPFHCREELVAIYAPTAQDVVDALRLVLTQDDAEIELVRVLVGEAPDTDGGRGVELLLELIRDGRAKVRLL